MRKRLIPQKEDLLGKAMRPGPSPWPWEVEACRVGSTWW